MATVWRCVRGVLRPAACGLKGVLAVVAVAAVVAWPWSHLRPGGAGRLRWAVGAEQASSAARSFWLADGWIRVAWAETRLGGRYSAIFPASAEADRAFREWAWWSGPDLWKPSASWGPFRWEHRARAGDGFADFRRGASVPLWLLACAAGVWPAVSFALWARRRRQPGQCRGCGYDLRATPDATGPTLARCPECGRPAPPADMRLSGRALKRRARRGEGR